MSLQQRVQGDALVVKVLVPHLDSTSAPILRRRIAELTRPGISRLVIDISSVEFIDSDGLSSLVFALKRLGGYRNLAISGARASVISMFKLTRLYAHFNVFQDCEEAIAALHGQAEISIS